MRVFTIISNIVILSIILLSIYIMVCSQYRPSSIRSPRLGWLAVGVYSAAVGVAFLLWGRSAEGIGIASILLGLPWSFGLWAIFSPITAHYPHIIGPLWHVLVNLLLLVTIVMNCRLAYILGIRLPVLWRTT